MQRITVLTASLLVMWLAQSAESQVSVQLPRQSVFSVGTTVSVPDRGGVFLGGVSRVASSRSSNGIGPLRSGSSVGFERSFSGASAHVFIHDLDEMDRMLLNAPVDRGLAATEPPLNGLAGHAHRQLVQQHARIADSERFSIAVASGGRKPPGSSNMVRDAKVRDAKSILEPPGALWPPLAKAVVAKPAIADPVMASRYRREAARASERGQQEIANLYLRLAQQCEGESTPRDRDVTLTQRARRESE
ncbi:MAG: hypothetical protein HZA46_07345 [Planctomycetales bacterium]|nr:hypothetical protein [Planctomycetales bacterium]